MGTSHLISFEVEECCNCGMPFGMTASFLKRMREKGESFYCPAGHGQHYTEGEIDKLKGQLREKARQLELQQQWRNEERKAHEKTQRSLTATRGVVTRIKGKVSKGLCPCCQKLFVNLQQHMGTKHPDYEQTMESKDAGADT